MGKLPNNVDRIRTPQGTYRHVAYGADGGAVRCKRDTSSGRWHGTRSRDGYYVKSGDTLTQLAWRIQGMEVEALGTV